MVMHPCTSSSVVSGDIDRTIESVADVTRRLLRQLRRHLAQGFATRLAGFVVEATTAGSSKCLRLRCRIATWIVDFASPVCVAISCRLIGTDALRRRSDAQ